MYNSLDFDGMLDRVIAGEQLPDSIVVATANQCLCTEQGKQVENTHLCRPRAKKTFDITLIRRGLSSRPATIETDGNLPEVIFEEGEFFKVNLGLGEPYLYQQIYAEKLSDIEVNWSKHLHPSLPESF
jgi:hypothetical protein